MEANIDIDITKISRIKPLNPSMFKLIQLLEDKDSGAMDLQRVIESDANTTANILRISNSPFYGLSGRITTVSDACVLLGYDQLKNIIYSSAVDQATNKGPHSEWRQQLFLHTLAAAVITSELVNYTELDPPMAYPSGLLHELGKQIVLAEFPDDFNRYMDTNDVITEETHILFFNTVGKKISENWRLPKIIQASICHFRNPAEADELERPYVEMVTISHHLANSLGFISPGDTISNDPIIVIEERLPNADPNKLLQSIKEVLSKVPGLSAAKEELYQ